MVRRHKIASALFVAALVSLSIVGLTGPASAAGTTSQPVGLPSAYGDVCLGNTEAHAETETCQEFEFFPRYVIQYIGVGSDKLNYYYVRSTDWGGTLCLNSANNSGGDVLMGTCNTNWKSYWHIEQLGTPADEFQIRNRMSQKCIEVLHTNLATATQNTCNGASNPGQRYQAIDQYGNRWP